jgi:hypothetical protein
LELRKIPEHRKVGVPTCPENTEEPELLTRSETSEVRLELKMSENLDIRPDT